MLNDLREEIAAPLKPPASTAGQSAERAGSTLAPVPVEIRQPEPGPLQILECVLDPLLGPLTTTGVIVIFVIFILLQREDLRDRLIKLAGSHDLHRTTAAIDDAARRLSRYFPAQAALNAVFGVVVGLGLAVIGVPSPVLWGILAMILRFVPYIGAFIAAAFPLALAAAVASAVSPSASHEIGLPLFHERPHDLPVIFGHTAAQIVPASRSSTPRKSAVVARFTLAFM